MAEEGTPAVQVRDDFQVSPRRKVQIEIRPLHKPSDPGQDSSPVLAERQPEQLHRPCARGNQRQNHANCGAFPRTVRSEESENIPATHGEVQPLTAHRSPYFFQGPPFEGQRRQTSLHHSTLTLALFSLL